MERITAINPQRLQWCLDDLGTTAEEAARAAGTTTERLTAVLDGEGSLTFNQLQQLATFVGRSVLFLIDPAPIEPEEAFSAQYRTIANQKPELTRRVRQLVQRAEQQRTIYQALLEDDDGVHPAFDPPALPADPTKAAVAARQWLALDNQSRHTFDTYRAAVEARGVLVFRTNGYAGRWQIDRNNPVEGFALYDPAMPVIVVRKHSAEPRMVFTLMHELGHLLLHRASSVDDRNDLHATLGMERDANRFAAQLLVPDAVLAKIDDSTRPTTVDQFDLWLKAYRKALTVSTEVLLLRLVSAGRLKQAEVDEYRQWRANTPEPQDDERGTRIYRHREPHALFGESYVRTVLAALSARRITLKRASDYLDGLRPDDVHKLERWYALGT
jgi:Zn-dependent peptidase ImmA (M78 family)